MHQSCSDNHASVPILLFAAFSAQTASCLHVFLVLKAALSMSVTWPWPQGWTHMKYFGPLGTRDKEIQGGVEINMPGCGGHPQKTTLSPSALMGMIPGSVGDRRDVMELLACTTQLPVCTAHYPLPPVRPHQVNRHGIDTEGSSTLMNP